MSYYLSWLEAGLFGYVIPWWFWASVGLAGAIAVFVLLPALVPERLRGFLAVLVFLAGAIISAGSWGIDHGIQTERASWVRKMEAEKQRLREEADAARKIEQDRAEEAEKSNQILTTSVLDLQGQIDALKDAPPAKAAADGTCPPANPVVVPESIATGVLQLHGRRAGSRGQQTEHGGGAKSPRALPRLRRIIPAPRTQGGLDPQGRAEGS